MWCVFGECVIFLGGCVASEGPVGSVVVVFLDELVEELLELFDALWIGLFS